MKDFMMIFIGADYADLQLSPEQMQAQMGKWFAWNDKMRAQGIVKDGHALHAAAKRLSGADKVISDGPFVESKELVGGYYVISADSIEAACEVAKDFPDYDLGGVVEVREIMVFE